MRDLIYFDHAAATPLDPRVLAAMMPYFEAQYANPSSIYHFAQKARQGVDEAREEVGKILDCSPREILFTSCGTESNNFFILGAAAALAHSAKNSSTKGHIITTKIEHESVLKPIEYLESQGFEVTYLDVDKNGLLKPDDVEYALRDDTIFVSIIYANNEIGTVQPIAEIAERIKKFREKRGKAVELPFFHTDACQAAPYLDISIKNLGVDAMTLNGSKIYGPKGVGVLYVKEGITLVPQMFGGGQEYRKRSGTENVPAIVGFAKALSLVQQNRQVESSRLTKLRDKLIDGVLEKIPRSRLNGDRLCRLPNNVNVSFSGIEGESILLQLDMHDIAASSGSACTSGALEPSHVIRALGLGDEWTHSSTRFTLGHSTTEKEVDAVLAALPSIIKELSQSSPFL